ASDHAEDFTSRSLPFEGAAYLRMRLRQRMVLFLHLLKEPGVLDGNDGLVSKRCDDVDFFFGKRLHDRPEEEYHTDRLAFPHQWHAQHAALSAEPLRVPARIFGILEDIRYMDGTVLECNPAG